MKKYVFSFCLVVFAVSFSGAQAQFGAGLQFLKPSIGSSLGIGAEAVIGINDNYALNPSFHYYFEEGSLWAIDADVQYTKLVINDEVRINPFAGLNLIKGVGDAEIGINLGLHVQAPINESFELYVEPKLILISDADGFAIGAGILF